MAACFSGWSACPGGSQAAARSRYAWMSPRVLAGVCALCGLIAALAASPKAVGADSYPYLNFNFRAPGAGRTAEKSRRAGEIAQQPLSVPSLGDKAESELKLSPEELTKAVLVTPATISSDVVPVKDPLVRPRYQLGFSLQPYRPEGRSKVGDLQPFELDGLGFQPLASLDFRWLPWHVPLLGNPAFEWLEDTQLGVAASVGYSQHVFDLRNPGTGLLSEVELHTFKVQTGVAALKHLHRWPEWLMGAQMTVGRIEFVQSSASSEASQSSYQNFVSVSALGERRLAERWSAWGGYEYRHPIGAKAEEAELVRNSFLVGVMGSFQ